MKTQTKKEMAEQIKRLESQLQDVRNERKQIWNKYDFINFLEYEIKAEIESGQIEDEDQIQEYIDNDIDNACIYYKTCFEIAMELNAIDFTEFQDYGDVNSISQLAYAALRQYVDEELNRNELIELIEAKQQA